MIYPVRMSGAVNAGSATDLVKLIADAGLCMAAPAKQSVLLKATHDDPNEMKALWDMAREFRDYVKKNPADADYVLYADYGFNPQNWEQGIVHFVVCDRKGEWVIVECRTRINPITRASGQHRRKAATSFSSTPGGLPALDWTARTPGHGGRLLNQNAGQRLPTPHRASNRRTIIGKRPFAMVRILPLSTHSPLTHIHRRMANGAAINATPMTSIQPTPPIT